MKSSVCLSQSFFFQYSVLGHSLYLRVSCILQLLAFISLERVGFRRGSWMKRSPPIILEIPLSHLVAYSGKKTEIITAEIEEGDQRLLVMWDLSKEETLTFQSRSCSSPEVGSMFWKAEQNKITETLSSVLTGWCFLLISAKSHLNVKFSPKFQCCTCLDTTSYEK